VAPYVSNGATWALSIGIIKNGQNYFYNYGACSAQDTTAPSEESIYEIGSITKTFTATILAQMVSESMLKLEDPIDQYLPPGLVSWPDDRRITFEDLATHRSGLPRIPDNLKSSYTKNPSNPYQHYSEQDLLDFLQAYKPIPLEKRKIDYSNFGVGLLGYLLVKMDGQSDYETLVKKRIFDRVGMDDSFITEGQKQLLTGHNAFGMVTPAWDLNVLAGAGAIRSNTTDMLKYVSAQINERLDNGLSHQARYDFDKSRKIGLTWFIKKDDQSHRSLIWHDGGTGGFRSFVGFSKEPKIGVVVLSNAAQHVDKIGFTIFQGLLEEESN
jgi:CubicO group peptidase (beta-lactamase class C family)